MSSLIESNSNNLMDMCSLAAQFPEYPSWAHTFNSRTQFTVKVFFLFFFLFQFFFIPRKTNISSWHLIQITFDLAIVVNVIIRKVDAANSTERRTRKVKDTNFYIFFFMLETSKQNLQIELFSYWIKIFGTYLHTYTYVCLLNVAPRLPTFSICDRESRERCAARENVEKSPFLNAIWSFCTFIWFERFVFFGQNLHQSPATSHQRPKHDQQLTSPNALNFIL